MEVVKESKTDTGTDGNFKTLTKTYIVSAYDSGKFHIRPFEMIKFRNKDGVADSILSNYIFIAVNTVAVDTTKDFKPIKAPAEVPLYMEGISSLHYWRVYFAGNNCWCAIRLLNLAHD